MSTPRHLKSKPVKKRRTSATAASSSGVADSTVAAPPTVPVARRRLEAYGNADLYSQPDAASAGAFVETEESLNIRDPDNKNPIVLTNEQMDDLVEFVKARPLFYDKSSGSWLNTAERLSVLKEWADKENVNGTIINTRLHLVNIMHEYCYKLSSLSPFHGIAYKVAGTLYSGHTTLQDKKSCY